MFGGLWLSANLTAIGVTSSFGAIADDLSSLANASVRPKVCLGGSPTLNIWRPPDASQLAADCNALARGYARLGANPKSALADAKRAERRLKSHGSPMALRAMALLGQGKVKAAWAAFEQAGHAGAELAPVERHDFARAAWMLGHRDQALEAYQRLVPMISLLPDNRLQSLHLEAGLLAMSEGRLADLALSYLNEAQEATSLPAVSATVAGALCLALDRASLKDAARGVAVESGALWPLVELLDALDAADDEDGTRGPMLAWRSSASRGVLLEKEELYAMVASLAVGDPGLARDYYGEYLDRIAGDHRWRQHAATRLSSLHKRKPR